MGAAIDYIRKDFVIIVICLIAILVCMLSYLPTKATLAKCNANCIEQFKERCVTGAEYTPMPLNESIGISGIGIIFNSENKGAGANAD